MSIRSTHDTDPFPIMRNAPAWVGYATAIASIAVLTAVLWWLLPYFPLGYYPISFVLLIMLIAYGFGGGAAVLTFFLGFFVFDYFFVEPLYTVFPLAETVEGLVPMLAYFLGTSVVGFYMVLIRRSRHRLEKVAQELRRNREDLNRAQAVAHTGSWRLEVHRNELLWSDETYRIFGIPLGTPLSYDAFLAAVHPEDKDYVDEKWNAALQGEPYDIEHRIVVDSEVKWIRERAELEFDDQGTLIGGFGTAQDITRLKETEAALRASEANYRAIFNGANDAIFIHDPETGDILDINRKAEEMYSYTHEELCGSEVVDLSAGEPPYTRDDAMEWVSKAARGEPQLYEWRTRDKFGRLFWVEINLRRAQIGGQDRLLAMVRDITSRKYAEEHERELEEHKLDFYRRTIIAATEGKLVICEPHEIREIAGEPLATWQIREPNDIRIVRHGIAEIARTASMDESFLEKFAVSIGEAATNVLKHAGGGQASIHRKEESLIVVLEDQGPGIPALTLPEVALKKGYSTAGTLGLGYKILISFSDRVYLSTGPQGTCVGIEKRLRPDTILPDLGVEWIGWGQDPAKIG